MAGVSKREAKQLENALQEEASNRAANLLSGVLRYLESPYVRNVTEAPVIWQKGNARLLDYGSSMKASGNRPIVLFIPSLINRYYILDLEEERSLVRFLAGEDVYPIVLDWGVPGAGESEYNCADYITDVLCPAIDFIARAAQHKIALAGYCMGGVMSLAAAQLKESSVSGLALLATPWDFHCEDFAPFIIDSQWLGTVEALINTSGQLPSEVIHSLFYLTDPWIFEQKFRRFATLNSESRAARDFVALERWVNDGVPMTAGVARDCLIGWVQENRLANNQWKVAGKAITPATLTMPALIAIPRNDHVVPYACAARLADTLAHAHRIHPGAGHVGMIVGTRAKRELWQPFADWAHSIPQL